MKKVLFLLFVATCIASITPNPATINFTLTFKEAIPPNLKVSITNMLGQQFELNSATSTYDVSGFNAGVYFVQLIRNENLKVMKLVISR